MKTRIISLVAALLLSLPLIAQKDSTARRFTITPLPILLNDPFTGFAYGALANANFLLGDATTTRYSNAQAFVMYTTKNQLLIQVNHVIFLNNEKWMIQGKQQYLDFPEFTYGLGGNTSGEVPAKENVSYQAIELEERFMKRIGSKNFIGPQLRTYNCWNLSSDVTDSLSFFDSAAAGNKAFNSTGIGLHFIHDSRDNVQNAYHGQYLEVAVNPYPSFLGSTQNWTNIRIDGRKYILLNKDEAKPKVIALRAFYEQALGTPPFMLMPMTGRNFTTRGYAQGRYRGKQFFTTEAEYRSHLWRALGYVLFANLQSVTEPDGGFKHLKPAGGAGLRIMLRKAQRTNLRIDYAMGTSGNSGLYLQITEAF